MENPTPQLSVTDLMYIKNIIELACARGTFQANEMRQTGEIYERLTAFLNYITSQAESQTQPQGESND